MTGFRVRLGCGGRLLGEADVGVGDKCGRFDGDWTVVMCDAVQWYGAVAVLGREMSGAASWLQRLQRRAE